jgi:hypothetical protein
MPPYYYMKIITQYGGYMKGRGLGSMREMLETIEEIDEVSGFWRPEQNCRDLKVP